MKLDLNAAWDQAVRLIGMNREVMLILAGVFFYLPYVLFTLLVPMPDFQAAAGPTGADSSALIAAVNGFVRQYWWAILLASIAQTIGALAVMASLGDPKRPTVQAAIGRGASLFATSFVASLLASFAGMGVMMAGIVLGALLGSEVLAKTLALASVPVAFVVWSSLSLGSASIAIERLVNPIAALRRSWALTRGSRLRLTAFYALLLVAFLVIFEVAGLVVSLATALPSAETAAVLSALLLGVVQAIFSLLFFAVQASAHRLLARAERTLEADSGSPDPV